MNKQEKAQEIERLSEALKGGPSTILVNQHGLTVNEVSSLRGKIRATSSTYRVIKNRLALRALKVTPLEGLAEHFKGPTAIAYGDSDPAALAKVIEEFAKAHKGLEVKCGFLDGRIVDAGTVKSLADLPPRPMLVVRFIGVLNAPVSRMMSVLKAPLRDLAVVLGGIAKKKEAGESPPADQQPQK